ncbi:MAG: hypothetical protein HRU15_13195 [Planctomycetes bacterium]|nr:hypothetical protein [Planctomycetota bacterium]
MSRCLECGYEYNKVEAQMSTICPDCGKPTQLGREKQEAKVKEETARLEKEQEKKKVRTERVEKAKAGVNNAKEKIVESIKKDKKKSMTYAGSSLAAIVFILLIVALVSKDLSTPSKRIIGHWKSEDNSHHYFGPQNEMGVGEYTYVANDSDTQILKYEVYSEVRDNTAMKVKILKRDGSSSFFTTSIFEFNASKDGEKLSCQSPLFKNGHGGLQLQYVNYSFNP